jgi:hypothetical protein
VVISDDGAMHTATPDGFQVGDHGRVVLTDAQLVAH